MDQRNEPRAEANAPVVITDLRKGARRPMGGMILEASGSGMRVKLRFSIPVNALVRMETSDLLLLGEVMHCEPDGDGFRIAVSIRHSLQHLPDLVKLNTALVASRPAEAAPPSEEELVLKASERTRGPLKAES